MPPPALRQLSSAFSAGHPIQHVQLSGTATWYSGSTTDSGPITLSATSSGATQVHLSLGTLGEKAEAQTEQGSAQTCTWSGSDSIQHNLDLLNCWKPTVWFLPALSLQPTLLASSLGISDLGIDTVGPRNLSPSPKPVGLQRYADDGHGQHHAGEHDRPRTGHGFPASFCA